MTQKLVYPFVFEEESRSRLTFSSSKIRLNPATNRIELAAQSRDPVTDALRYPTDADLWVKTWTATPQAVRTWLSFFADPYPIPAGTTVGFKLNDGTSDYYWGGAAWVLAGASTWSTLAEVNAHIQTFPTTSRALAVVVNLKTTDPAVTPAVAAIDILMECELDYLYSLIAGSVGQTLKEELRVTVDYALTATGGNRVSLLDLETMFNIISVGAAYNHQTDPRHLTNLLSTYDPVAKDLLLTAPVVRGAPIWIKFIAEPEVYINWGSQDYVEVERIPAIVIDGIDIKYVQNVASQEATNIASRTVVVRRLPLRLGVRFAVVLLAEKNRTLLAMMEKALQYTASNPVLRWRDIGQDVSVRAQSPLAFSPRPNLSDKHESSFALQLDNVYLWLRPEEHLHLVEQLNLVISRSNPGGPLWAGAGG